MNSKLSRRHLLSGLGAATGLAACSAPAPQTFTSPDTARAGRFAHGIASGDPTTNAVILWTRISPNDASAGEIDVIWEVAATADFTSLIQSGVMTTFAARDWTVKVDATGLEAGATYYYRFRVGDQISPVGKTKTLPSGGVASARFAVVSCANWQEGFFNVYDHIGRQDHFDALIHLGDYYYEYGARDVEGTFAATQNRLHAPAHEIITLTDYRQRHAQYRSDAALQSATQNIAMISIWDDHETSNDSWRTGAENHDAGEGSWEDRKRAALRAYYEWMPIRDPQAESRPRRDFSSL
ncbi:alkaline phosphatase [Litorimonas sp. RW-G-Af-16]|uniref:alkaline phosphatase D family protein n=1 Tax=Litorimonas sp. RW-G-Af-16 TaxID=3241168 RepID=UPI003AAE8B80